MKTNNLSKLKTKELLEAHTAIMNELKSIGVLRFRNSPVGDLSEWLISKSLKLDLENNSKAGYDAIDKQKIRYQIKGRRVTEENKPTLLGIIRNLAKKQFDFLIGVIFDQNYKVLYAAKIPHSVIKEYASFDKHKMVML